MKTEDKLLEKLIKTFAFISFIILFFVIFFIFRESYPFFKESSVVNFIFGRRWKPISYGEVSFGIFPIITATIYIAFISVIISAPISVGCSIFLSCIVGEELKEKIKPYINLLAGIPSVIYGFIGLVILVKGIEKFGLASGESVLAGGILLAIMISPFIISTCEESMSIIKKKYEKNSMALGISKWYMIENIIIPVSIPSIFVSIILALVRALGETMAVMMVIGNAPIFPRLLGKSQTISSLIAIEMGMAEVGSIHYSALFASGFILMILIFFINLAIDFFKNKFLKEVKNYEN